MAAPKSAEQPQESQGQLWGALYVGRMPLVGWEAASALLPQGLVRPLQQHLFVALGPALAQQPAAAGCAPTPGPETAKQPVRFCL